TCGPSRLRCRRRWTPRCSSPTSLPTRPPTSCTASFTPRSSRRSRPRRQMPEKLFRAALREALDEEMTRDDRVYLIGEDIGRFGGAYRVTEGLQDKFGEMRVVDAPIAEEVIVGSAIGAAMAGLRPVVEMMTINFSL